MFPNIDTIKGIETIKLALQSRPSQKPFADCILQGLEICLYNKIQSLTEIIYYKQKGL